MDTSLIHEIALQTLVRFIETLLLLCAVTPWNLRRSHMYSWSCWFSRHALSSSCSCLRPSISSNLASALLSSPCLFSLIASYFADAILTDLRIPSSSNLLPNPCSPTRIPSAARICGMFCGVKLVAKFACSALQSKPAYKNACKTCLHSAVRVM